MVREYKDSKVDWIGQIPKNWKSEKFKHIFRIKKIIAGKLGYDVLSVTQQGLKVKNINEGQVANDYSNYQIVHVGDFVMNHMDLLTGYVDVSKQEGVTSPDYRSFYAIHKHEIDSRYYLYIFQFCYMTRLFYNLGHGVSNLGRWRLPAEQQNEFILPFPPLVEQQLIADYLDKKCAEIDELIGLQEKIIAQLTDYKQSVITETVMKGLNPDVEFVPSGNNWIGNAPKGWKVYRLKELGYLYGGLTGKSGTDFDVEEDDKFAFFIPFTNIFNNLVIDTNKLYKVKVEDGEIQNEVHKGDLLFLMSSEDYEGIGKPALLDASVSHLYLNSFCKGLRIVSNKVAPKFLLYMLTSHVLREQIRLEAKGFIRINLRQDKLMNVFLSLPPVFEQKSIAEYLDNKCFEIDGLVNAKRRKIETLKEYKKSLIYEAVTGKTSIE